MIGAVFEANSKVPAKLRRFLLTVLVLCLIPATRYYQIDVPL